MYILLPCRLGLGRGLGLLGVGGLLVSLGRAHRAQAEAAPQVCRKTVCRKVVCRKAGARGAGRAQS